MTVVLVLPPNQSVSVLTDVFHDLSGHCDFGFLRQKKWRGHQSSSWWSDRHIISKRKRKVLTDWMRNNRPHHHDIDTMTQQSGSWSGRWNAKQKTVRWTVRIGTIRKPFQQCFPLKMWDKVCEAPRTFSPPWTLQGWLWILGSGGFAEVCHCHDRLVSLLSDLGIQDIKTWTETATSRPGDVMELLSSSTQGLQAKERPGRKWSLTLNPITSP